MQNHQSLALRYKCACFTVHVFIEFERRSVGPTVNAISSQSLDNIFVLYIRRIIEGSCYTKIAYDLRV